ncbi:MAG TPA: NAD(P)-dependent oxidoreductase [Methylomirabilota bacterium]|jgi:3-hydroxyisobutyrate dehydrogenase-like beta-hydroxyacid dehydrogenase|nr:NAD(P)-dependent oxidoreductase [Methylomirabilota bacterium]
MTISVGFIGLGNMGLPMAQNLLKTGRTLHVYNRTQSRAESLLAQGATWAPSPRAVAQQAPIVISMLADDAALQAVALGDHGVLSGLPPDGVHVDMSTVSPDLSKDLTQRYRERGAHYLAAPVFGRPDAAAAAKLWICPAGPANVIERCRPLFTAMGQGVIVVGDEPQLANVLKLVGNFFVVSAIETLSEAFTLAEKAGLAVDRVLDVVKALLPVPLFQGYGARMAHNEFVPPGFTLRLGLKDVGLMRQLAEQAIAPLPLADIVHEHLRAALAKKRGELDWGAVITVVRELAGLPSGAPA